MSLSVNDILTKRLRLVICEANIVFGRKVSLNASCQSSRQDAEIENFPIEQRGASFGYEEQY